VFAGISDYISSLHWPTRGDDMFQYVVSILGSPFIEVIIFILLVVYFVIHRHDRHMVVSGIRMLQVAVLAVIFFYFTWMPLAWASLIPPSLRVISVCGMFVINFYFLYSLILARMERPYRDALANLIREPKKHEIFREIWSSGKKFYYICYIFQSLFSGANPFHFLRNLANDRVRDDIKDALRQMGVEKKLVTLSLMIGFMKSRLAGDQNLPADFKEVMGNTLDDLLKHPWLEEQVNDFLRIATETPEEIHFPEWTAAFEQYSSGRK
jgi:Ca2+/Na+ antiporter